VIVGGATALAPTRPRSASEPPPRVGVLALGGLGGSSRVACDLARGLAEHGHAVYLLSSPQPWWQPEAPAGVGLVSLPIPREPRPHDAAWVEPLAQALVQAVLAHDLEVLSVHYGVGLAAAAVEARRRLACRGRAPRVCVTLHGTDVTDFGEDPEQGPVLARALRACDAVTAVSGWLADRAQRTLGLRAQPQVIANAVDTTLFHPADEAVVRGPPGALPAAVPKALGRSGERPRLCHASNFRPVKRPLDALEVLARLRRDGIDAELVMVGDGPLRAAAHERTAALGLAACVRFMPPASPAALAGLLRTVDLSIVTSESESFGLFALESMASGVPVLGTRCGGLQEVLAADRSGKLSRMLLADVGDVDELARLAAAALTVPSRLHRLRRRALALGRTAFPREQQLHAFAHVLARPGAGGAG
jgi:N-acetyl-alpha-D-glucosaminyl L-malate synthase BshA